MYALWSACALSQRVAPGVIVERGRLHRLSACPHLAFPRCASLQEFSEPKTFDSRILVDPIFFAIYNCHFFYLVFDYFVECVSVSFSRFGLRRVAFTCFAMRMWLSESVVRFGLAPECTRVHFGRCLGSVASGRHPPRPVHRSFARVGPKWSRNGAEISEMEPKWRRDLCTGSRN